jgi:hypothetical protein
MLGLLEFFNLHFFSSHITVSGCDSFLCKSCNKGPDKIKSGLVVARKQVDTEKPSQSAPPASISESEPTLLLSEDNLTRATSLLYNLYPETRQATAAQISAFDSYEEKDQSYAKKDPKKTEEQDLILWLCLAVHQFYTKTMICVFGLDSARMAFGQNVVESFGDDLGCYHSCNPCLKKALGLKFEGTNRLKSPYRRFLADGIPVSVFAATTHELFNTLHNAVFKERTLTLADIPRYMCFWYDGCTYPHEDDFKCWNQIFELKCFMQNGPSIFAVTMSHRNSHDKDKGNNFERHCHTEQQIHRLARIHGYVIGTLFKPLTERKGSVYTLIFVLYPQTWMAPAHVKLELESALCDAAEGNSWINQRTLHDHKKWGSVANLNQDDEEDEDDEELPDAPNVPPPVPKRSRSEMESTKPTTTKAAKKTRMTTDVKELQQALDDFSNIYQRMAALVSQYQ